MAFSLWFLRLQILVEEDDGGVVGTINVEEGTVIDREIRAEYCFVIVMALEIVTDVSE